MEDQIIDIILFCPKCLMQHVDEATAVWSNPPHRSHLCQNLTCGHIWRPSDMFTNGVKDIKTFGKHDGYAVPI